MKPDISEEVNACFERNRQEALKVYSPEIVFNHLFVNHWFDLVRDAHFNILDSLVAVGVARGRSSEHSMWQLIASGVAQHQSVEALEKYGHLFHWDRICVSALLRSMKIFSKFYRSTFRLRLFEPRAMMLPNILRWCNKKTVC